MERSVGPRQCRVKWQITPDPVAICYCGVVDSLLHKRLENNERAGNEQLKTISEWSQLKDAEARERGSVYRESKFQAMELEHLVFLKKYERWVDQYVQVVEQAKNDRSSMEYANKIMELKKEAEQWQKQIGRFLKNREFKQRYLQEYKRFANAVESDVQQ